MDKEYEILADRLIKALKGQNEEQSADKLAADIARDDIFACRQPSCDGKAVFLLFKKPCLPAKDITLKDHTQA